VESAFGGIAFARDQTDVLKVLGERMIDQERYMATMTMREALNNALAEEMERDSTVYLWGENVEGIGGGFMITSGLSDRFGGRVKDTPLAETAIVGTAVGAAFCGLRPVIEIMFADFSLVCMDELVNKMAKMRYCNGAHDRFKFPVVVRMKVGGYVGLGCEHSQTPLAYFMHTPGLKMAFPTTPHDAKGMLKAAIRDNNPVLFFEHVLHYGAKGEVPDGEYLVPLGEANVRREGGDVTLAAIGYMVDLSLQVADAMAAEGISLEVIDLRCLEPLDLEAVMQSVTKTGRIVVVDEDVTRCGVPAEILMQVYERLREAGMPCVPMARVGAANVPIPYSPVLEKVALPSVEGITRAVRAVLVG
jgi:pyruvate/2-oxoglutarate/acetoin dehydrogenase E1 component